MEIADVLSLLLTLGSASMALVLVALLFADNFMRILDALNL